MDEETIALQMNIVLSNIPVYRREAYQRLLSKAAESILSDQEIIGEVQIKELSTLELAEWQKTFTLARVKDELAVQPRRYHNFQSPLSFPILAKDPIKLKCAGYDSEGGYSVDNLMAAAEAMRSPTEESVVQPKRYHNPFQSAMFPISINGLNKLFDSIIHTPDNPSESAKSDEQSDFKGSVFID